MLSILAAPYLILPIILNFDTHVQKNNTRNHSNCYAGFMRNILRFPMIRKNYHIKKAFWSWKEISLSPVLLLYK